MRTLLVLFTLVAAAFAGCVGDDSADPADDGTATTEATSSKDLLDYEVDPNSANETDLMGAHTHDEWGGTDKITLFDDATHTEKCSTFTRDVLLAAGALTSTQEVHKGCAFWRFEDGVVVPEGTESLMIDVDATDALDYGSMQLWYRNGQREFAPHGEPSSDPVASWTIPVETTEWDIPHAEETTWFFQLRPSGNPAVLEGEVEVFIVANKIEGWVPILGSAHIDHWAPDAAHTFISPDIMQIMSQSISLDHPSWVSQTSGTEPGEAVVLDDIVPPGGTVAVAAVLKYDGGVSGCPPGHEPCWVRPYMQPTGTTVRYVPSEVIQRGETFGVYVWNVPEPVVPDSTYAKESGYSLFMDIRGCPNGEDPNLGRIEGCAGDTATDLSADVEVLMWAYRGSFDPNGIKSAAGV